MLNELERDDLFPTLYYNQYSKCENLSKGRNIFSLYSSYSI